MNKEWRNILLFMGALFVIAWLIIAPSEENSEKYSPPNQFTQTDLNTQDNSNLEEDSQDSIIKYRIDNPEVCREQEVKKIHKAIQEIENKTDYLLKFIESDDEEILFICLNETKQIGFRSFFGSTETYVLAETYGNLIENTHSEIRIYKNQYLVQNVYPDTEIHEILHALGINHSDKTGSIMNPETKRSYYTIDQEIINQLKEYYSS